MKIYIIRHGESEYNKKGIIQGHIDIPLSYQGKIQAQQIANHLIEAIKPEEIKGIFSSDLLRAKQTAEPLKNLLIKKGYHIPIKYRKDLREINLGVWEGKTKEQLRKEIESDGKSLFEKWLDNPVDIVPEKAESMINFYKRAKNALIDIIKNSEDNKGSIIIFTHGGIVSMLKNYVNKKTVHNLIKYSSKNASGPIIEYKEGQLYEIGHT